jgi:hypothetical protein
MQVVLNCFFYVGALNETVGYGTRVARFLLKATLAKTYCNDAFALKEEATGNSVLTNRSLRRAPGPNLQPPVIVAESSQVTVKNLANITLIQDLTVQAIWHDISSTFGTRMHSDLIISSADAQRARLPHLGAIRLRPVVVITRPWPPMVRCWRLDQDTGTRRPRWRVLSTTTYA